MDPNYDFFFFQGASCLRSSDCSGPDQICTEFGTCDCRPGTMLFAGSNSQNCCSFYPFSFGVCDGIFERFLQAIESLNQPITRAKLQKMGNRARIPASIAMTLQMKEGGLEGGQLLWKRGGNLLKWIAINFACFLLLPKNGSIRNNGLKYQLTYDFDFALPKEIG